MTGRTGSLVIRMKFAWILPFFCLRLIVRQKRFSSNGAHIQVNRYINKFVYIYIYMYRCVYTSVCVCSYLAVLTYLFQYGRAKVLYLNYCIYFFKLIHIFDTLNVFFGRLAYVLMVLLEKHFFFLTTLLPLFTFSFLL